MLGSTKNEWHHSCQSLVFSTSGLHAHDGTTASNHINYSVPPHELKAVGVVLIKVQHECVQTATSPWLHI